MLHSCLTNIFNQKSPTQKFNLHTGLENILSIFTPGQLWIIDILALKELVETHKIGQQQTGWFVDSWSLGLPMWTEKDKEKNHLTGKCWWQKDRCGHQSQHLLFSFPALIFLIKLLEHQLCLYQCFPLALGFSFKLCNSLTTPII